MKIHLFIVTYKSPATLQKTVDSIIASDFPKDGRVTIINNHSEYVHPDGMPINVIHNEARPDWSTGHLARSWNQCILRGFKSLLEPDCDILVTAQDDTVFLPDSFSKLIKAHETYGFITAGWGDALCSYTPEAVRMIGLWDERFCGTAYQEADYFLRAFTYFGKFSSINDGHMHGRVLNPIHGDIVKFPERDSNVTDRISKASMSRDLCRTVFELKWPGVDPQGPDWPPKKPQRERLFSFVLYPYFEKDVKTLKGQGYIQ